MQNQITGDTEARDIRQSLLPVTKEKKWGNIGTKALENGS